jgi:glycosyltransferase involved in cell wall biosynthesis
VLTSPKITLLTAVHNGTPYLSETISNIQSQDFEDWEYIVVDDASTDRTLNVVERAMRIDSRIRLVRCLQRIGPYAAANEGLNVSLGQYIFRIDADDLSPVHRFRRQLEFLAQNPQYRGCVSFWQPFNEKGLMPGRVVTLPTRPGVFKWYLLLRGQSIHSSACIERSALLELGGYRSLPLSQDYRLWCEMTQRNWLGVVPEVLSYVRMHDKRQTNQRAQLQRDLAMDVVADHLKALTGQVWTREELNILWAAGYSRSMPISAGLAMLDRWDRLWQADAQLTREDHEDLVRLSRLRRWKLLRANVLHEPMRVLIDGLKLGIADRRFSSQARNVSL